MRSLLAVCIVLGSGALLQAQTLVQPGTLAAAFTGPDTSSSALPPKTTIAAVKDDRDKTANRVWVASAFAMAAGSGFDAASSWGKREGNGLLASSNGDFGAKGLAIKAGVTAALIVPQFWLHKHRDYRTKLTVINFVNAGIFTGVAIHNLGIAPPPNN